MILYRQADSRYPMLWEDAAQPPARWHRAGQGPAHYLTDTPDGAWAEFVRHEAITDPADLEEVRRALWAVEVPDTDLPSPELAQAQLTGGEETYEACQAEADRLRSTGAPGLRAPSAALHPGEARGWRTDSGLRPGPDRDGYVIVLFGRRPELVGWASTRAGTVDGSLLGKVRQL